MYFFSDSKYSCEKGETSTIFPGKCISQIRPNSVYKEVNITEKHRTGELEFQAERYCTRLGMELPTVENDLENRMIRGCNSSEILLESSKFRSGRQKPAVDPQCVRRYRWPEMGPVNILRTLHYLCGAQPRVANVYANNLNEKLKNILSLSCWLGAEKSL